MGGVYEDERCEQTSLNQFSVGICISEATPISGVKGVLSFKWFWLTGFSSQCKVYRIKRSNQAPVQMCFHC